MTDDSDCLHCQIHALLNASASDEFVVHEAVVNVLADLVMRAASHDRTHVLADTMKTLAEMVIGLQDRENNPDGDDDGPMDHKPHLHLVPPPNGGAAA